MTAHFSPKFMLHYLLPQPSAEPSVSHHWGVVHVAHGKFPAALLSIVHTLASEDIKALQEFGLLWCEISFSV
jgi:hypothetical protein